MGNIQEVINTMTKSVKYSLAFCLRNDRKGTIARLVLAFGTTLLSFGVIQMTGLLANAVQAYNSNNGSYLSVLWKPATVTMLVLTLRLVMGRMPWYYISQWREALRFANERERQNHAASLDIAGHRSQKHDDLKKRIEELPFGWGVRIQFTDEMISLLSIVVSFFVFGFTLWVYNPLYAVVVFFTAIPMMIVELRETGWWWKLFEELVPHHKKRHLLQMSYAGKINFLQASTFSQFKTLRKHIDTNTSEVVGRYNKVRREALILEFITHTISMVGLASVLIYATLFTMMSGGEIGTLAIIIATAITFQGNLDTLVSVTGQQWNCAKGIILIEEEFFGLKPFVQTENPIVPNFDGPPSIHFDRVSFTYPDTEVEVLHEVSFSVDPGSKVAIAGQSGHGKSTILSLLMRHYDPTSGAVYADGINLRNIEPSVWTETATALMQEYVVHERKIGEEIASSRLHDPLDQEMLSSAAKFSNFDEVIEKDPHGFESQLGIEYGGRDLSGGEKQRLALAKTRYRNCPVLILDEADAKLDPISADKVMDEIFALEDVTVILITHHVSRAERCDKVILMKDGRVAEQGKPQELLAKESLFARVYHSDKKRLRGVES